MYIRFNKIKKMESDNNKFEVCSAREMRAKYGLVADNQPLLELNRSKVPKQLWSLIPYAETWGIADDLIREDFVSKAPKEAINELKKVLIQYSKELDDWLAGPEATVNPPSIEYIAFSAMRMAIDFLPQ